VVPNPVVQGTLRGKASRSVPDLEQWTSEKTHREWAPKLIGQPLNRRSRPGCCWACFAGASVCSSSSATSASSPIALSAAAEQFSATRTTGRCSASVSLSFLPGWLLSSHRRGLVLAVWLQSGFSVDLLPVLWVHSSFAEPVQGYALPSEVQSGSRRFLSSGPHTSRGFAGAQWFGKYWAGASAIGNSGLPMSARAVASVTEMQSRYWRASPALDWK